MKSLFFALLLAVMVFCAGATAVVGFGIMIWDLYSGGPNFMTGFNVFFLGAILFFVSTTSYIITKVLTNTEILSDVMSRFLANEMQKGPNQNPLQNLFSQMGFPGATTSIKVARMDEDGNITPMSEADFDSADEMLKHRDEILSKLFGNNPIERKKKIQEMTIEELQAEEKKAVSVQDFELAAAIKNLLDEKQKG